MRALLVLTLISACTAEPSHRIDSHDPNEMALERLGAAGPFVAGTHERFRLLAEQEGAVTFTASAGRLAVDGRELEWTVPYTERAWLRAEVDTGADPVSSTFHFGVWAVPTGARGPVDIGDDNTGDVCDLEIDSSDTPHVIYRNDTHPSLWYASYNGSAWQTELVDGMGWDIGGEVSTDMALTLDASGTPHIVYLIAIGIAEEIRYATPSGSTWLIETVATSTSGYFSYHLDIEMDGTQPVVLYSRFVMSQGTAPVIAYRTGPDAWTLDQGNYGYNGGGGLERDSSGVMHVSLIAYDDVYATTWSSGGGWGSYDYVAAVQDSYLRPPLALDDTDHDIIMHDQGLDHDLGGRTWSRSEVEYWAMNHYDLAFASIPHMAVVHGDHLELITPDSRDYWVYANVGSADGPVAVAVDTDGNTHACYQYDNRVMFY